MCVKSRWRYSKNVIYLQHALVLFMMESVK